MELVLIALAAIFRGSFFPFLCVFFGFALISRGIWPALFADHFDARLIEQIPYSRRESRKKWAVVGTACCLLAGLFMAVYQKFVPTRDLASVISDSVVDRLKTELHASAEKNVAPATSKGEQADGKPAPLRAPSRQAFSSQLTAEGIAKKTADELDRRKRFPADLTKYSQGLVVEVSPNDSTSVPGTGFWISDEGDVATCSKNFDQWTPDEKLYMRIDVLMPFLDGDKLKSTGGVVHTGAQLDAQNGAGIGLLSVALAPLKRSRHAIAGSFNAKTGHIEGVAEQLQIAHLTEVMPQIGDPVWIVAINNSTYLLPVIDTIKATVKRLGLDASLEKDPLRIYIDSQFKTSFCGAPVLNASLETVGIVVSGSGDEIAIAPSKYIIGLTTRPANRK